MAIEELQNGRYMYLRRLGSGGMGEVYLMQDTRVNRQVAIKVLRAEGSSYSDDAQRTNSARLFEREARAIAALDHPNILPLYDFGEEVLNEGSMTYMVMPYCADGSLETWLRPRGEDLLPAPQVAALIEQAAEGLQYAHEHKVIHLDVKPPNFLIRQNRKDPLRPALLLADFGIARNFTTVSSSSRTIRGTPAAMAPEQWSGEPVFASDQYALAVMTYEMLVGRPPFIGSMEQLMYRHFSVQPQPPSTFNPRLPSAMDAVLLRALSKKPEERYPTIVDFASALIEAANQPSEYSEAELAGYSTLTITPSEAEAGLSRMLTLAGGEEVAIAVPAGAQHGQVLRLPRADAVPGEPDVLLVNIAIQRPEPETPRPAAEVSVRADIQEAETAPSFKQAQKAEIRRAPQPARASRVEAVVRTDQPSEQSPLRLSPATPVLSPEHDLPTVAGQGKLEHITTAPPPLARPRRRSSMFVLVALLVVAILILAGSITLYTMRLSTDTVQITPTHVVQPTPTATPSPTPVPPGQYIAGTYNGTMASSSGGQSNSLSVHIIQNNGSGALHGTVTFNSASPYTLKGVIDLQGNFSFSVEQPSGQLPFIFHGTTQSGGFLHGNYCQANTSTCPSDAGFFTVGPRY